MRVICDRLVVFLGILWNRCREVSVEFSRSRRSHGRPEVWGSSSQRTDIWRTLIPVGISQRFANDRSRGERKLRTVYVMENARVSRYRAEESGTLLHVRRAIGELTSRGERRILWWSEGRGQGNLEVIERMTFDQQASFEARSWTTTRSTRWRTRLPDRHRRRFINGNLELGWNRPQSV